MRLARFGIERRQRRAPRIALREQRLEAITVDRATEHLFVDIGRQRHRVPIGRLRDDAIANGGQGRPFVGGEEPRAGMHRKPLGDGPTRRLIPRQGVALVQDIVAWKTIGHRSALSISVSAAMPPSARPAKLGGAGMGGPSTTFWRQFFQPPIARDTP